MNNHYIWIKANCDNYYKFLNRINKLNINILEIKYEKNKIYLKVTSETYEKINKYLVSYKFKKVRDLGLYSFLNLKKYRELIICLVIGFILLFLATNIIVDVNVIHEKEEIRELLTDELNDLGIKKLSFKKSYKSLEKIKKYLLDKYPDKLDWLEFEIDGMVINVRVEERILTDISKSDKKCNIVAKKEGTISSIKISKGEAIVNLNDLVKTGDILISGVVSYNNENKMVTCAKGEVYAKTWYNVKINIPFNYNEYKLTGKKKYNLVWVNDNKSVRLLKARYNSFSSTYKTIFELFDYKLLLETEYENEKQALKYNEDEALEMGIKKGEDSLKLKLGAKDTIIDKKVLKKYVNDSKMELEIFFVVNELISEEKIMTLDEAEGMNENDMGYNQTNSE